MLLKQHLFHSRSFSFTLQSLYLAVYVPDRLSQVLNSIIGVLSPSPADVLYGITEMEAESLIFDEVNNLNPTAVIVVWVVHVVRLCILVSNLYAPRCWSIFEATQPKFGVTITTIITMVRKFFLTLADNLLLY